MANIVPSGENLMSLKHAASSDAWPNQTNCAHNGTPAPDWYRHFAVKFHTLHPLSCQPRSDFLPHPSKHYVAWGCYMQVWLGTYQNPILGSNFDSRLSNDHHNCHSRPLYHIHISSVLYTVDIFNI